MAEKEKLLQWHAAFFAGIQIELEEEADYLIFENEHMLSTKPMQVDVLIIKKNSERVIRKNIGQIFRKYNIVEYKSPEDYLSVDDFYKVYGYACFYKSDSLKTDAIKIEDITVSYVCYHYPRVLMKHLAENGKYSVENKEPGIYYIFGAMFPIQILVTAELSEESNLWLRYLSNNLNDIKAVERLTNAYEKNANNNLYSSVMEIVVRANEDKFREVKKMCQALKELFKEEFEEKLQEGFNIGISQGVSLEKESLIRKKILKNKTLEQIVDDLETTVEEILPIYNRVMEELL